MTKTQKFLSQKETRYKVNEAMYLYDCNQAKAALSLNMTLAEFRQYLIDPNFTI